MQSITQEEYKLVGTSDMKMAKQIGKPLGLWNITHGDGTAHMEEERHGLTVLLIVNYKGEVYELERTKRVYAPIRESSISR